MSSIFFFLFMVAPVAYRASQARGRIGAAAEAYATATVTMDPSHVCNLHHSLWQHWTLNPLSEARHRTQRLRRILNPAEPQWKLPNEFHFDHGKFELPMGLSEALCPRDICAWVWWSTKEDKTQRWESHQCIDGIEDIEVVKIDRESGQRPSRDSQWILTV